MARVIQVNETTKAVVFHGDPKVKDEGYLYALIKDDEGNVEFHENNPYTQPRLKTLLVSKAELADLVREF